MADRHIPVRPNLDQLKHQAKDLLHAIRQGDPVAIAELRKLMRFVGDELEREYHNVTPLAWGERFHEQDFVSRPAMRLIAERGGQMS